MLNWIFKKPVTKRADPAAVARPAAPPSGVQQNSAQVAADKAAAKAAAKARQVEEARAEWAPRLALALGDDAALLRLARDTPLLELKLAAVQALVAESALKQAERDFRSHDRKVHRLAKQRHEAALAQREARAAAQALIETATALTGEALLPVNLLVALDQAWDALDAGLLEPDRCARFTTLRERLASTARASGEQLQRQQRWVVDTGRVVAELQAGLVRSAAQGSLDDLAVPRQAAQALHDTCPDVPATSALDATLATLLHSAGQVEMRLAWLLALDALDAEPAADPPADPSTAALDSPGPAQRWQALPPLADRELARLLDQRFEQWQRAQAPAPCAAAAPIAAGAARHATFAAPANAAREHRLDHLLQEAESELAAGHLAGLQRQLQTIGSTLDSMPGVELDKSLQERLQALHAEHARLKGWQQWGSARARDDLAAQAEALARATRAAADPAAPDAPKLRLQAHGEALQTLRARWKELDRLGAGASQALWHRFDAALQIAHEPVAAQQALLKAARQDNLRAREALLAALEAAPLPPPPAEAGASAVPWKEPLHALVRFQLEWRQLGPLEHTVPVAARSALQQRLRHAVDRIEVPLQQARDGAAAEREQLIVHAESLVQEAGRGLPLQELTWRVRELQSGWQQQARSLPLARVLENRLWARFKAATDAVFAQRDAAFSARDSAWAGNLAARQVLLDRLSALGPDAPAAEVRRTLDETDRAWRQDADLPRGAAAALDARYGAARAAVSQRLADKTRQDWQAQCDTLAARLVGCEQAEGTDADGADLARRESTHAELPAAWERALAQRRSHPAAAGPLSPPALDELLLQLELALDLPAAPESLAARRQLKLRALKDRLESRVSAPSGPALEAEWLAAALRQRGLGAAQRERLHGLVAALRQAPPGSLGAVSPARRGDAEQVQ